MNEYLNKITCGDCLEHLKKLPDNSVDCIITDPPYNINYFSNYGSEEYKQRVQTAQKWDNNFDIKPVIEQLLRIAKTHTHILIFGCEENIKVMQELGCYQILIWNKQHCGMGNLSDFGIGYEFIFYFRKGKPALKKDRINGVIDIKHIGHFDKTLHPTQKPLKLIRYLLDNITNENDIILDPFMGSGTTAVACKELNRNFIGFELSQEYVDIANKRLARIDNAQFF